MSNKLNQQQIMVFPDFTQQRKGDDSNRHLVSNHKKRTSSMIAGLRNTNTSLRLGITRMQHTCWYDLVGDCRMHHQNYPPPVVSLRHTDTPLRHGNTWMQRTYGYNIVSDYRMHRQKQIPPITPPPPYPPLPPPCTRDTRTKPTYPAHGSRDDGRRRPVPCRVKIVPLCRLPIQRQMHHFVNLSVITPVRKKQRAKSPKKLHGVIEKQEGTRTHRRNTERTWVGQKQTKKETAVLEKQTINITHTHTHKTAPLSFLIFTEGAAHVKAFFISRVGGGGGGRFSTSDTFTPSSSRGEARERKFHVSRRTVAEERASNPW